MQEEIKKMISILGKYLLQMFESLLINALMDFKSFSMESMASASIELSQISVRFGEHKKRAQGFTKAKNRIFWGRNFFFFEENF